jgi:ribosome-binding factor A
MSRGMSKPHHDPARGPSQRQLRVGELIRRSLSELLARGEIHDPDLQSRPITVGEVRISPDLKVATVHVMPLGGGGVQAVIDALARNQGELRRRIGAVLALKFAPDLRFRPDGTFDALDETRRLFAAPDVARDLRPDGADDPGA